MAEWNREIERERDLVHSLVFVPFPYSHRNQIWNGSKPGARNCSQVSHTGSVFMLSSTAFSDSLAEPLELDLLQYRVLHHNQQLTHSVTALVSTHVTSNIEVWVCSTPQPMLQLSRHHLVNHWVVSALILTFWIWPISYRLKSQSHCLFPCQISILGYPWIWIASYTFRHSLVPPQVWWFSWSSSQNSEKKKTLLGFTSLL